MEPPKEGKSTREWLEELPYPYRALAIANFEAQFSREAELQLCCKFSLHAALMSAFLWKDSYQGFDYWNGVGRSLT